MESKGGWPVLRGWTPQKVLRPPADRTPVEGLLPWKVAIPLTPLILTPMSTAKPVVTDAENKPDEFNKFTNLLDRLLAVPHSEIKAKLDAEKQRKKAAKSDLYSDHASGEKG
jgi:hypothetical protein